MNWPGKSLDHDLPVEMRSGADDCSGQQFGHFTEKALTSARQPEPAPHLHVPLRFLGRLLKGLRLRLVLAHYHCPHDLPLRLREQAALRSAVAESHVELYALTFQVAAQFVKRPEQPLTVRGRT